MFYYKRQDAAQGAPGNKWWLKWISESEFWKFITVCSNELTRLTESNLLMGDFNKVCLNIASAQSLSNTI